MRREGEKGEAIARSYLERAGFCILASNFSVRGGEIDIIACGVDGVVVFFEVKLRHTAPEDHSALLPFVKRQRMMRVIRRYCAQGCVERWRCDLLLIVPNEVTRIARVVWYRNVII